MSMYERAFEFIRDEALEEINEAMSQHASDKEWDNPEELLGAGLLWNDALDKIKASEDIDDLLTELAHIDPSGIDDVHQWACEQFVKWLNNLDHMPPKADRTSKPVEPPIAQLVETANASLKGTKLVHDDGVDGGRWEPT